MGKKLFVVRHKSSNKYLRAAGDYELQWSETIPKLYTNVDLIKVIKKIKYLYYYASKDFFDNAEILLIDLDCSETIEIDNILGII